MNKRGIAAVLWTHTIVMGLAGSLFFLLPAVGARAWPWPLPPLAARFMGSLFVGGAACSFVCLRRADSEGLLVMVLLAAGDVLIAAAGMLAIGEVGLTPPMIFFLAFYLGIALILVAGVLPALDSGAVPHGKTIPRALRWFLLVHLVVVLPVGIAMFFFPQWAQPLWPWRMTPLNVRLIGAFFLGAAPISIWALAQRSPDALRPVLALYACFTTLATLASLIHVRLFDPARVATWAFFALYVFVAAGSGRLWWQIARSGDREGYARGGA